MVTSKRGQFDDPAKSPWNFEKYDSGLELRMMVRLEGDPMVERWTKRHGITIPWIDGQKHQRSYRPDFLVQHADGQKLIIEVKDPSQVDSPDVQRKRKAAEIWCKQRGMEYVIATIT